MLFRSWLHSVGCNHRRARSNGLPAAIERMEDRSLLSVAALFVNGELFVSSDGGDTIAIRQNASSKIEVLANGAVLGTTPNVATSSVTSIVVKGGDDTNNIDLNQVTNVTYPNIASIRVDGGNGNDTILGSPFYGDSIQGGDGKDTIAGQDGADTIDGGDGNDSIVGGNGDDSLIGEDGSDTISGDAGNDTISGGNHQDVITGGDGNDSIDAGQNNDTVSGGNGNDTLNGSDGADSINGDAGNDSILGGAANDFVSGDDGDDTLLGQAGVDTLNGSNGNDSLDGGTSGDSLSGNLGNDTLNGGAGDDSLFGNEGDDLAIGGAGKDLLDGFIGNDTLKGQGGDDSVFGGGGADSLEGNEGDDLVDSGDPILEVAPVAISVNNPSVTEGDSGTVNLSFTLSLSSVSFIPVTVRVSTADGFATAGVDYTAITNQLVTIVPGSLTATVNVQIAGDTINELDETVRLVLSNPTNARLQNQEGIGTIINDDTAPLTLFAATISGDLYQVNTSSAALTFVGPMLITGIHDITTNGTGNVIGYAESPPRLFQTNIGTGVSVPTSFVSGVPNETEGDMAFDPVNNVIYEIYHFGGSILLGNPHLYRINPATGVATDLGGLTVGGSNLAANSDSVDISAVAFRNGTIYAVAGSGITGTNANFNGALMSIDPNTGVATRVGALGISTPPLIAGAMEYDAATDTFLLIEQGILYRVNPNTGAATLVGDTSEPLISGLTLAQIPAIASRSVSVGDVAVVEGNQGTTTATFRVTADAGIGNLTVSLALLDGTATSGSDYVAPTLTPLTFGPSGGTQLVTVTVNGDFNFEADETFFLQITSATGAVIADGTGLATIINDDLAALGDTLLGNTGNDTLVGGPAGDFINGDGGFDLVFGNSGDDTILGGDSADTINGGDGNDSIDGQGGADVIDSGNGDDLFMWSGVSSGSDTVTNASGADGVLVSLNGASNVVAIGQSAIPVGGIFSFLQVTEAGSTLTVDRSISQVTVDGGAGDDTITVNDIDRVCRSALVVLGSKGDDLLTGLNAKIGQMRLRMEGGDGNDTIVGTQGDDTLAGDAGNDRLRGGLGNDLEIGGSGIDSINGDDGNDTLIGGDGSDTLVGDGADTIFGDAGNDSLFGDQGNDILAGGEGDDTASGGDGNDTITGDAGNDSLSGNSALDSISGGNGNDTLDGGRNDDILNGGAGNDKIRGDHGNDTILGGTGNDTINGGDGDDVIQGQAGNDLMTGADGDDLVIGGEGNDIITGGDGDDTLLGGNGNDIVLGEQGDDSINGQSSTDTLAGGQGDDTIVAAAAGEVNEIFTLNPAITTLLDF